MEFEAHVGELAELYAAGALDERERSIVLAHVSQCEDCLRRLGEAEETVLALERRFKTPDDAVAARIPLTLFRSPNRLWYAVAIAAALVVGFLIPHPQSHQSSAMLAMIQSHFSHAQFGGPGPAAKVLYARDRSWYYVIVQGSHEYGVYGIRNDRAEFLGTTRPGGLTSDLFVRSSRFDAVELRDRDKMVERAAIR